MNNLNRIASAALVLMFLLVGCKSNQADKKLASAEVFSLNNMDLTVKPGDDFFDYVNGTWIKTHPIPSDKSSYDVFVELLEKNRKDIMEIIDEASAKTNEPTGVISQKIGDLYNSGMDTLLIEQLDLKPLDDFFTHIDNIKTINDVQDVSSYLQLYGVPTFFSIFAYPDPKNSNMMIANTYQAGIGLPDRDYYLKSDGAMKNIREAYLIHLQKMFELLNENPEIAAQSAKKVMAIETRLAKASFTNVDNQDPQKTYNMYTLTELKKFAPDYNWVRFFKNIGYPSISQINLLQPTFISEVNKMMKTIPVEDWKTFFRWELINVYSSYLSKRFEKQNFDFYYTTLSGIKVMPPRWKTVLDATSNFLGEAVGQLYVEKFFPPDAKSKMLVLTDNLKASLKSRIENLAWMGPETKNEALAKLENMKVKIGYPDKWRDYSGLEIKKGDYLGNVIRSNRFEFEYDMNKVGKTVDRTEWDMTPQTVNAYYDQAKNEIVFPAGILQPPFFNRNADDAINYGAIGVVIGHEMTHGFDNGGRQYDKDGNLRDWWSAKDAQEFETRTNVLVNQFNNYEVFDSVFINGKLTLGENIADLGGVTVAYNAYQLSLAGKNAPEMIDGFSGNQRFFLGFAQIWRGTKRDEAMKASINIDPHSPAKYRVNGTVFDIPEFYTAFPEVSPDSKLFIPVENRPVIW